LVLWAVANTTATRLKILGKTIDFIGNPHLSNSSEEMNAAMATWPFQPATLINNLP
jgi:hypothetical protein